MANELAYVGLKDGDLSPVLGSPSMPIKEPWTRKGYAVVALLLGLTSGIANGVASVDGSFISGHYGTYSDQENWLTVAYFAGFAPSHLLWIKMREHWNATFVSPLLIFCLCVVNVLHIIFAGDFVSVVILQYVTGFLSAVASTSAVFYMLQSAPTAQTRPLMAMCAICFSQAATPFVRIISPALFYTGDYLPALYFQLGMTILCLVGMLIFPLPPSQVRRIFQFADFVTYGLFTTSFALLLAVIIQGRVVWWDTHWLWICAAASALFAALCFAQEYYRNTRLIRLTYIFAPEIMRWFLVGLVVRILLAESSFSASGFMSTVGMGNDQLIIFGLSSMIGIYAGIIFMPKMFNPQYPQWMIVLSLIIIAVCSFVDAQNSSFSNVNQFYITQFFMSVATVFFFGTFFVTGLVRMLLAGSDAYFASFVISVATSQSLGGVMGSAILGTFQIVRERFHSQVLTDQARSTRPEIAERIAAEGASNLQSALSHQANLLAYLDTFMLTGALASAGVVVGLVWLLTLKLRNEHSQVVIFGGRGEATIASHKLRLQRDQEEVEWLRQATSARPGGQPKTV